MKETVALLMSKTGDLATTNVEKAEVLTIFLLQSSPTGTLSTLPNEVPSPV